MKNTLLILAGAVVLSAATTASAIPITWNVAGIGPVSIVPSADTITADANSGTANLIMGVNTVVAFNTFDYFVGDSGQLQGPYGFDVSRMLTVGGISHLLNQTGVDNITPGPDIFTVNLGTGSATYILGNGYAVDVTVDGDIFTGQG
jgi:hypothetical protein